MTKRTSGPTVRTTENVVVETADETRLASLFPKSTAGERRRFLTACKGDATAAAARLSDHAAWRETLVDEDDVIDDDDDDPRRRRRRIPPMLFFGDDEGPFSDVRGNRLCQVLAARTDVELADPDVYASALSRILAQHDYDRDDVASRISVCLDVRPGIGWANPTPLRLIPHVRTITRTLNERFPERLATCVVHPLPAVAKALWKLVRRFLDPDVTNRVVVVAGPAAERSPPPTRGIAPHIDANTIARMERLRESYFDESTTTKRSKVKK